MFQHTTVLQHEAIEGLHIKEDGLYVDCTLGGAGHSLLIAKQLGENGHLFAFDQDEIAIDAARERLQPYENKVTYIHSNFRYIQKELHRHGVTEVDGILFDLGVSSPQLDDAERGFSYNYDAKLDMRMNQQADLTAYEIVNKWSYEELVSILFKYGEERFSKRIARKMEQYRKQKPIETTKELVEIVKDAIPAPARRTGGHPARRTFQAIRIAVNDELASFREALIDSVTLLRKGGRLAVITFHSLEDRICTEIYRKYSKGPELPRGLPIIPEGYEPDLRVITKKPIEPSKEELSYNNRARSARLRIAEKN